MENIRIIVLCIGITSSISHAKEAIPELAIPRKPIVELVGQPMQKLGYLKPVHAYEQIPICGKQGLFACPRIHQLIFNEVVTIKEKKHDEVCIELSNLFFQDNTAKKITTFWTHKKNLIFFSELKAHNINTQQIPQPIAMHDTSTLKNQVILAFPYYDPVTTMTFSAGTRFVKAQDTNDKKTISVYALHPKKMKMMKITLPHQLCLTHEPTTKQGKIALFVTLLSAWANTKRGFIPYVWGGCSFTSLCTNNSFDVSQKKLPDGEYVRYFNRAESPSPPSGFDCAGLVARATQICGIPYFYKNTTTLAQNLKPLSKNDKLTPGDLIWFPGHVMVVGNATTHSIIEARHYGHGYGKIHELPLEKVFNGLKTHHDLVNAFFKHQKLERLNSEGNVAQTIPTFKLLRLASVWENS